MTAVIPESHVDEAPAESDENGYREIIRPPSDTELQDVLDEWSRPIQTTNSHIDTIKVDLESSEPTISFGRHEVPSTSQGIESLLRYLGMPVKYTMEAPTDEQQFMITHRLDRAEDAEVRVEYTSDGLEAVRGSKQFYVDPGLLVEKVAKHMPADSHVRDHWLTGDELRLDVYTSVDTDERLSGGDRAVGDLTLGGIRIFQNRKMNQMPEVQTYLYRLVCTNGMEVPNEAIRVDGRRGDLSEVFEEEIEAMVIQALEIVQGSINSYYDMRLQKIEGDRTGVIRRMAREAGLSDRAVNLIADQSAAFEEPTMFDFTNMITNLANGAPRTSRARTLQRAGGALMNDHRARCPHCSQALVHTHGH